MVAVQMDEITHLDFTPALPCEMRTHQERHANLPAAWVAALACPCGKRARVLVCEDGYQRLWAGSSWYVCGCGKTTRDLIAVVWSPIDGKGQ